MWDVDEDHGDGGVLAEVEDGPAGASVPLQAVSSEGCILLSQVLRVTFIFQFLVVDERCLCQC